MTALHQAISVPPSVAEAMRDHQLPLVARVTLWHLASRLDLYEFREVKAASLACEMRIKENTASQTLLRLASAGYLDMHEKQRPRAYRLLWSRRQPEMPVRPA
jgi:hypothetical protein